MITLVCEIEPLASDVRVTDTDLQVQLKDGRMLSVPLSWLPRLEHAGDAERRDWQILGGGYAIEWPQIDEHVLVEGLLAGRNSNESRQSLERWLGSRR